MYVKYLQSARDVKIGDLVVIGDVLFRVHHIVGPEPNVLGDMSFGLTNITDITNVANFGCTSDFKFVVFRNFDHQPVCAVCSNRRIRMTVGMTCMTCERMFQHKDLWGVDVVNVVMETLEKDNQ